VASAEGVLKRALALLALLLAGMVAVALVRALLATPAPAGAGAGAADAFAPDAGAIATRLAGALRFPTISREDATPAEAQAFTDLHAFLERSYPRTHAALRRERVGSHGLLYTWPGREPDREGVLLAAHQDVVPVPDAADWRHPPFAGEIADGEVWGRGALDDKGSLICILDAVESLLVEGFAPERTVYLAFGHDEEIGGEDGALQIAATLASRGVRLDSVLDEGSAVAEGFRGLLDRPVAAIGVAEKGWIDVRLRVEAAGGHSSTPPKQTAVGILAAAIAALERQPMRPDVGGTFQRFASHLAPEVSFSRRLALANLWLLRPLIPFFSREVPIVDAMIRTTTAATIVNAGVKSNVLPREAVAIVNFRVLPGDTTDDVLEHVRRVIADERVSVASADGDASNPSPVSPDDGPAFLGIAQAVKAVYPDAVAAPFLVVGATDARHYTRLGDAVYRLVPFRIGEEALRLAHGKDERVAVANLASGVRFYRAWLKRPLAQ
jgi:carboxypeptidase PM20D1